mmetsp:Transcript_7444/g.10697  ORF Transcript_7444/g.10697 Transcript_7444/m.10697 type:complete len:146 (+) Transcript_7444:69-506(+)
MKLLRTASHLSSRRVRFQQVCFSSPSNSCISCCEPPTLQIGANRSVSTQSRLVNLQNVGLVDDVGHTNFSTLHELQVNSCKVFHSYKLFGTFKTNGDSGCYDWMNYAHFNELVGKARIVLKDVGTSITSVILFSSVPEIHSTFTY